MAVSHGKNLIWSINSKPSLSGDAEIGHPRISHSGDLRLRQFAEGPGNFP